MVWITAGHEEQVCLLIVYNRRDELFGRTIDHPMSLPVVRIIAGHAFIAGENHLGPAGQLTNEWHTIAAGVVFARRFPESAAIFAAERDEVGIAVMIAVHDDLVFVKKGRT